MCKIVIAHCKPKNAPHASTLQVSTKWVRTRTSQLATAHRNWQLAIAHRKSCLGCNRTCLLQAKKKYSQRILERRG